MVTGCKKVQQEETEKTENKKNCGFQLCLLCFLLFYFPVPLRRYSAKESCFKKFLAAADERHLGGHDRHEQDVGIERQACHVEDGSGDMLHIHGRFDRGLTTGLQDALLHLGGHFRLGIAAVDLPPAAAILPPPPRPEF